jgi:hypothetical protein
VTSPKIKIAREIVSRCVMAMFSGQYEKIPAPEITAI